MISSIRISIMIILYDYYLKVIYFCQGLLYYSQSYLTDLGTTSLFFFFLLCSRSIFMILKIVPLIGTNYD